MPLEKRVAAAAAFWRDRESPEIEAQHAEAIGLLAQRMKSRTRTVAALPVDRRARYLGQIADVSETIATRALIAYHFETQRPLMATFLDALGIEHDNGLITSEEVTPPTEDQLRAAVDTVRATYPSEDVDLYLRTLVALDGDTWAGIEAVLPAVS